MRRDIVASNGAALWLRGSSRVALARSAARRYFRDDEVQSCRDDNATGRIAPPQNPVLLGHIRSTLLAIIARITSFEPAMIDHALLLR